MQSPTHVGCSHLHGSAPQESVRGSYSRMFAPAREAATGDVEQKLIELGASMRYTGDREGTLTPRIGYTYLGQFIGHDISHDGAPLAGPYTAPEETPNYRTPWLELDHLYGGGAAESPHVYEGGEGAETFKIGLTTPGGHARDVPLDDDGFVVADRHDLRNFDNLILRQLQVVFLKFHNETVRQLSTPANPLRAVVDLGRESVFEAAQRLVRWHYQWFVRHDFLPRVLQPAFWQRRRPLHTDGATASFAIPIEFTLAAFRYGHSIVRRTYPLNCVRQLVGLVNLLREGQRPAALADDSIIEWGRYFDGLPRSGPPAASSFIDTAVVEPLHAMPLETVRLCSRAGDSQESPRLAERTLLRGARSRLASGQQVAAELVARGVIGTADVLQPEELVRDAFDHSGSTLRRLGLQRETPLFYYLLKEAELRAGGLSLGPVGSHIVGEVLLRILERDPGGYMAVEGPAWKLPEWEFPNGTRQRVNSMAAVIRLIGDSSLLLPCARKAAAFAPEAMRQTLFANALSPRSTAKA